MSGTELLKFTKCQEQKTIKLHSKEKISSYFLSVDQFSIRVPASLLYYLLLSSHSSKNWTDSLVLNFRDLNGTGTLTEIQS